MNSNRIRELFGSYTVDVLQQSAEHRIASLCSIHDGRHVCRTLAVTLFMTPTPAVLADADRVIRSGESIGETFERMGIQTEKLDDHWCRWTAGDHFAALTDKEVSVGSDIGVRLYTLRAEVDGEACDYAVIAEAYHPAHIATDPTLKRCAGDDEPSGLHRAAFEWLKSALNDSPDAVRRSASQQG